MYLSPAFRGNRNVTVGREALICFALFSFLSMPCIIMIGHGAHRRQGGSQLAAEPACSRRVRAPSETWGDGCSRQVGEATTRRVTWAWGWFDFVSPDRMHALGKLLPPHVPLPLRLINSVEQTSTRPSHGKVLASLSYEPLGVCSLVRRQTPVGHGVFMPCHKRVAPARTPTTRVRQMVEHSGDP